MRARTRRRWDVRVRAIRSCWALARTAGFASPATVFPGRGLMDTDAALRAMVIRAWELGHRAGVRDGLAEARRRTEGSEQS